MDSPLRNKTAVITGATSGIGFQTMLDFAAYGAFTIGVGRDQVRCEQALSMIMVENPGAKAYFLVADLARQSEIMDLGQKITVLLNAHGKNKLDVLVNNAGIYAGKRMITEDGIEKTFAVNHLAPFLLTYHLLPLLRASDEGRVITVSSNSHYKTWFNPAFAKKPLVLVGLWAYKVSKLSNILFSAEFNRRNPESTPHAFAVDPGLVNTDIGLKQTDHLTRLVWRNRQKLGVSPSEPSSTIQFLAGDMTVQHSSEVYWHDSAPKQPSSAALNQDLARRLWEESCRLCNISDYFGG